MSTFVNKKLTIIFDFDGTLVDSIDIGLETFNEIAHKYKIKTLTKEEAKHLKSMKIKDVLSKLNISKFKATKLVTTLRKRINKRIDEIHISKELQSLIKALYEKKFQLGILSSNMSKNISHVLNKFNLNEYFDFIESGVTLFGKSKRISKTIKKQKLHKNNVIYVGDEIRDIIASKSNNIDSIAVSWGANNKESLSLEKPTYCVDTCDDLIQSIFKWEQKVYK